MSNSSIPNTLYLPPESIDIKNKSLTFNSPTYLFFQNHKEYKCKLKVITIILKYISYKVILNGKQVCNQIIFILNKIIRQNILIVYWTWVSN